MKCEVLECQNTVYQRLSIGPGTSIALCEEHFITFKKELMVEPEEGGDIVSKEKKGVLDIKLEDFDIPKPRVLPDLLQEWVVCVKPYGSLIGADDEIVSLYQRSREAVKKWGRDD